MTHRHTWLYVDKRGKELPAWKRRCACGVEQTWSAAAIRAEKAKRAAPPANEGERKP